MKAHRRMGMGLASVIALAMLAPPVQAGKTDWQRHEVDWRMTGGTRVKAVRYPADRPPPMLRSAKPRPAAGLSRKALGPEAALRMGAGLKAGGTVYANVIDAPPVDGFVPWLAVLATDAARGELELDAEPSMSVVGSYLVDDPANDYAIGLLDTGASITLCGNAVGHQLGLFQGGPANDYLTSATVQIIGVTGNVDAWVSWPLGVFVDGLGAVNPNTHALDTGNLVGEWNTTIGVGQPVTPPVPDLPTAIGAPLAIYFTVAITPEQMHTINRDNVEYTAPDVVFYDVNDPNGPPEYPNLVPLELRPLGAVGVQYIPCLDYFGGCPDGFGSPSTPSVVIDALGNGAQSLYFFGAGVDLYDGARSAIDKDRFILDTGAQITVIGSRIGARLRLNPNQPEFEIEVQGVTGTISTIPGFYVDLIEIPALGEWLSFTNVPVGLLDISSPEGGTLDGVIGMNLFVNYNLVVRGGGLFGYDDPSLDFQFFTPAIDADFDDDGDVDQADFGHLQACVTGPWVAQTDPNCADALLDIDTDVDHNDLALFESCASGPHVAADPECTQ